MPNIFKAFSKAKAEPYQFPDAAELAVEPEPEEEPPAPEDSPPVEVGGLDVKVADPEPEVSAGGGGPAGRAGGRPGASC